MNDNQLVYQKSEVQWDLRKEFPALYKKLMETRHSKWLGPWMSESDEKLPTSKSYKPFEGPDWHRPWGHARAIYRQLPDQGGTLCLKGTEAFCPDITWELSQSTKRDMYMKYVNQIEWWIRMEQKSPFVFTTKEGIEEATIAAQLQLDHVNKLGVFAKVPIPLKLFKVPDSIRDRYLEELKKHCDPQIRDLAAFVVSSGLSVYNYLYEGRYERLNLLWNPVASAKPGYAGRLKAQAELRGKFNLEKTLEDWVEICVNMLAIGWIPTNYNGDITGQMIRHVNAFLDGGFADLDSARRISEIPSDTDFYKSFWFIISELTSLYIIAMQGYSKFSTGMWATNYYPSPTFGDAMCGAIVWDKFRNCVLAHKGKGVKFDTRIELIFSGQTGYAKLSSMFESIYPEVPDDRPFSTGDSTRWS
jgi:hypothetical protein